MSDARRSSVLRGRPAPERGWSPPVGRDVSLLPAGVWWDAVTMAREPTGSAQRWLCTTGCVRTRFIVNPDASLTWLVPRGMVPRDDPWGWARISRYVTLRDTGFLPVPHSSRTTGPTHWATPVWPDGTHVACDPLLVDDLGVATLRLGPAASVCGTCPAPVWPEDEPIKVVVPPSARRRVSARADGTARMHPSCARRLQLSPVGPNWTPPWP